MDADREAEGRGQAGVDILPAAPAVGGPPDAVVVLLVEQVRIARRPMHVVHAMPGLAIAGGGGVVVVPAAFRVGQPVAPFPALPAVLGGEYPGGGDAEPELAGIARVRHDGVQHQPRAAGVPAVAAGMVAQRLAQGKAAPAVGAAEQLCGLGARVERAMGKTQRPDLRKVAAKGQGRVLPPDHLGKAGVIGRPVVHLAPGQPGHLPGRPTILRPPDARAGKLAAAACPDGSGFRIADGMVDRPAVAMRAAHVPA